jgi:oxygen-independent coproporphyrinogen-3 oxidase
MSSVRVSTEQIDRYNKAGPRYTSYPTVPNWGRDFDALAYAAALAAVAASPDDTLSVYVHLPFCAHRCAYCGCNATVTRHAHVVDAYLNRVERELAMVAPRLGGRRKVNQLHWGGGTPNLLNDAQAARLMGLLTAAFDVDPAGEIALEMDPRIGSPAQVAFFRSLGFNRVSYGVQDIDPQVQVAIDRIQPFAQTERLYAAAREQGFASVNLDLVYGLPYQTAEVFARTLDAIAGLRPDRVACFSYAHLPNVLKNQKQVDAAGLPTPYAKFALFQQAVERFTAAGYDWIGMDHFALSADELSVAAREKRLHRNFMGYTLRPAPHLIGLGTSAIGDLGGCYVQNDAGLGRYQKAIDAGTLPVVKGHRLSADDRRRRAAINHLMCNLELPLALVEDDEGLVQAVARLAARADEGLVSFDGERVVVTELGRYFVRNLGMELDAYLGRTADRPTFSKTV